MLNNIPWVEIFHATVQTLYMVFISSFLGILLGLMLGVALFSTQASGLMPQKSLHRALGIIVNIGRSVPYIILMIALIPLTRWIVGTSIGINAALVPLTIAAIPFYARIAESAFAEVPHGLIEAGKAMGATPFQILLKILLPESLPGLIRGATLTVIGLVGYSAMAGAVGGGGLGELAINYGYQRFEISVMLITVIFLVILVQCVQWVGDILAKQLRLRLVWIFSLFAWILCFGAAFWPTTDSNQLSVSVGIMSGADESIMKVAQKVALDHYHLKLNLVLFNDYVLPNVALNSGNIDANIFQHVPYLDAQNKARHFDLVPIAKTFIYPMGFYTRKYTSLDALPQHAAVAIPNDPSNEGRALLLLQKAGLIRLASGVGLKATVHDIVSNPRQLKFVEMDAAQIPRALPDVAIGALTNDYVQPAGFTVDQALVREGSDSPYVNVIVVRAQDQSKPVLKTLVDVMHSQPVVDETMRVFPHGAALVGWK